MKRKAFQNFSSLQFILAGYVCNYNGSLFQNFSSLQFILSANSFPSASKDFKTFQVYSS